MQIKVQSVNIETQTLDKKCCKFIISKINFFSCKINANFPSSRLLKTHKVYVNITFSQDKLNYFTHLRERPELKSISLRCRGLSYVFFASGDMGAAWLMPAHKKFKYANSSSPAKGRAGPGRRYIPEQRSRWCRWVWCSGPSSAPVCGKKKTLNNSHPLRSLAFACKGFKQAWEKKNNEMGLLYALYVLCELYVSWPLVRCAVRVVIRSSWKHRELCQNSHLQFQKFNGG